MNAELYLLIQKTLKAYHDADLQGKKQQAYELAIDLVELTQALEESACDENKKV